MLNLNEKYTYELTGQMVNNLLLFLDRVTLKGIEESSAFQEIIYALNRPKNLTQENEDKK